MAVRFILGRAGAGKTRTCIDQVQQHLRQSPRAGPKLILLVPDQASLQTERALLSAPDIAGAQRAEVLNFRRFAQRLLQTAPAASARPISNIGRVMVLQRLVGELRSELRYFQSDRLLPGLYRQLSTQIEEFIVGAISPDDLQSQAVADAGDESARAKLSDLALLYDRYLKFLSRGFVDPAMALEEARQHLPAAEWVRGAHIWIDGFARLSEQQARFLTDLAEHAERVEVALLVDPADDGVAGDNAPDPHALFGPTVRTYHKLLAAFAKRHIPIEPPLFLPQADTASGSTRGAERRDLKHLQAHIFGVGHADERPPENISLIEAADAEDEIRLVVRRITALASHSEDPVRYRDIAIITRQLAEHHSLIAAALQDNNIPYFVDRRPPLGEHAVSFFLRALVGVATERFSTQTVRPLLKSDLLSLDPAQADRLENYIIAHRIAGLKTWTGPDWHRDPRFRSPLDDPDESRDKQDLLRQINATRRAFVEQLAPWINTTEAGEPPPRPGAHWARVLYETIERLEVPQQIERWALAAEGDGQTAEANHHRQAWRCVVQLLDDFATALGDSPMSRQEFAQILDAGLGQLDTGLVPPAVDQVLVGSIERSRHPDIRIAFVLGMNDGVWPRIEREPQLLNDDDRRMLTQAGLAVDPPCVENIGEDRLLAYVALTRPRDRLYVSYCRTDLDGRPLEPSPYLDELRRLFPALLVEQSDRAGVAAQVDAIATGRALIHALADRLSGTQDRSKWNAVYDRARQRDDLRRPLAAALRSLIDCNESTLSSDLIDDLSRRPLRTSITQLENYSACPFQHFAGGRLKLAERPTGELNALHLGALYHAVLDSFTQKLMDDKVQLRDLHDDQLNERLCDSISHFSKRFGDWVDEERGSQAFVWERLHYELLAALNAHRTIFGAGQITPIGSEVAFGLGTEDGLPALELDTPKGRRVLLRGKIDRVDTARDGNRTLGFVFDYKRSRERKLSISDAYHGLSLQLIVYLLALDSLGEKLADQPITPGGSFFLPLIPDYTRVDHPDESPDESIKPFRPRGILTRDAVRLLDESLSPGDSSSVIAAMLNKDGSLSKTGGNDAVESEDFERLMERVRFIVGRMCDDILDGQIPVRPYRQGKTMPCTYCDYRSVCRFEFPEAEVRYLDSMKKQEVWNLLKTDVRI